MTPEAAVYQYAKLHHLLLAGKAINLIEDSKGEFDFIPKGLIKKQKRFGTRASLIKYAQLGLIMVKARRLDLDAHRAFCIYALRSCSRRKAYKEIYKMFPDYPQVSRRTFNRYIETGRKHIEASLISAGLNT